MDWKRLNRDLNVAKAVLMIMIPLCYYFYLSGYSQALRDVLKMLTLMR